MKHLVMFSGGVGSWAAAKRLTETYDPSDIELIFTDTMTEHPDLYRFVEEAAKNIGASLVTLRDGRDIWQIFKDKKYMGNSRRDPCSNYLKREPMRKYIETQFTPETCRIYLGIDWTEEHRINRIRELKLPWIYDAPLCYPPLLTKAEVFQWLEREGIRRPALYDMGFPHNNCGGFCIKAGLQHFELLYQKRPDYYRHCEEKEQEVFEITGYHPFLKKRGKSVEGGIRYLSLREYREEYLDKGIPEDDPGGVGCACFLGDDLPGKPKFTDNSR